MDEFWCANADVTHARDEDETVELTDLDANLVAAGWPPTTFRPNIALAANRCAG